MRIGRDYWMKRANLPKGATINVGDEYIMWHEGQPYIAVSVIAKVEKPGKPALWRVHSATGEWDVDKELLEFLASESYVGEGQWPPEWMDANGQRPVDVISDVICPWCFIGKRRLEKAIAAHDKPIGMRWHPWEINPAMPKEGISRKEYRISKYGSWECSMEVDARIIAAGKQEGIHFDFDRMERIPNTLDAHRLIRLADQEGCEDAVVEALFLAYFTEGQDIGDRQTLIDLGADAGLVRQRVEVMLNSEDGIDGIKACGELARQLQIDRVPHFFVNKDITLSGAQTPEVFLAAFRLAAASTQEESGRYTVPVLLQDFDPTFTEMEEKRLLARFLDNSESVREVELM